MGWGGGVLRDLTRVSRCIGVRAGSWGWPLVASC